MKVWDVTLQVLLYSSAFFWLGVTPLVILSLIVAGGHRMFYGRPVIVWRGLESPDVAAIHVMKAAAEHAEADEDEESELLDRIR